MEGLDPTTPEAQAAVADLDRAVADLLATQITEPGAAGFGGWDPHLTAASEEIGYNGTFFRRTLRLARAWACPASKYYHSTEVATALNRALEYVLPLLEVHKRPNNWWAWDIGIPLRLGDTLLYAGGALSPSVRRRAIREQIYLTSPKQLGAKGGANIAWRAVVQMRTAMVTGDPSYLDRAALTMSRLLEATDAIQPDYSYFFHGPGLNLGYGFAHWDAACQYARLTGGTPWCLTPAARERLAAWTKEFFRWNAWKGMWSPWSMGRARTRPFVVDDGMSIMRPSITMDALSIARPVVELANAHAWPLEDRRTFAAMAVEHAQGPKSASDDPSLFYLLKHAAAEASTPAFGSKYYPYADYFVARRPNWYAAVRLNSVRTKTWFTLAGENKLGFEQAEGSLALMTDPRDFAYDVLMTMPYDDLPGVTRIEGLRRPHDAKGDSTRTGGVVLGDVGLAGFDYRLQDSDRSLRANKSYLALPDALVLIGSGIESQGKGRVVTTLVQVPRCDAAGPWLLDGSPHEWQDQKKQLPSGRHAIRLGDVGVVTLQPAELSVNVKTITAEPDRISSLYKTDKTYTRQFGGVRVEHGEHPTDAAYAAAILPGASPDEVAAFAAAPTVRVVANRAKAHVVQIPNGLTAACFFEGDRVDGVVAADGPLYLLMKEGDRDTTLGLMAPPGDAFGRSVTRTLWIPGRHVLTKLPEEVRDAENLGRGTSLSVQLKTGQQWTLTLSRADERD
ncbi:MAG: hypothetical protein JW818_03665 [Pirellulales bacterium]|nr:hypothetical protein [Pirellulales bacterium]